jgi:hypothetical protein
MLAGVNDRASLNQQVTGFTCVLEWRRLWIGRNRGSIRGKQSGSAGEQTP